HLPLASAVMSGPPLDPFWMRRLSLAPLTGAPVFLSTTLPVRRLLPRQSSEAAAAAATSISIAAAMIAIVFFKVNLPFRILRKKSKWQLCEFHSAARQRRELAVRRISLEAPRGPEAGTVAVADDLQRLRDGEVRGRRWCRLLQREDQISRLAILSLHGVQEQQIFVGLRIGREEANFLAEGALGLVAAAHARQGVADEEIQLRHRLHLRLDHFRFGLSKERERLVGLPFPDRHS